MKYFLSVMITFAVLLGTANIKTKNKKVGQNFFQKRLERLGKGFMTIPMPNGKVINLGLVKNAVAEEKSACDQVLDAVDQGSPQYTAGALSYFNGVLYILNNRTAADVENVFCHFVNTMEMDGADGVKTVEMEEEGGTMYVKVTISSSPSEEFATTNEYSKKAVVEISEDNSTFVTYMTMWWGFGEGSSDTTKTKGYLIEGSPKTLGGARANYMQWDLTGATQTGRFLSTEFPSADQASDPTTITPTSYWMASGGVSSDRIIYGRFVLNTSTNAVHIQGMSIEEERKQGEAGSEYGCFKILGTGVKGGMMVVAKTRDDHSSDDTTYSSLPNGFAQRGHFATGTSDALSQQKTIENLDAACMPDLTDTPNFVGNMNEGGSVTDWQTNLITAINVSASNAIDDTTTVFDLSCAELAAMNGTSKAFDTANGSTWVDFSNAPVDVFGTTIAASDDNDLTAPTAAELCSNVNESTKIDGTTKCYCPNGTVTP